MSGTLNTEEIDRDELLMRWTERCVTHPLPKTVGVIKIRSGRQVKLIPIVQVTDDMTYWVGLQETEKEYRIRWDFLFDPSGEVLKDTYLYLTITGGDEDHMMRTTFPFQSSRQFLSVLAGSQILAITNVPYDKVNYPDLAHATIVVNAECPILSNLLTATKPKRKKK